MWLSSGPGLGLRPTAGIDHYVDIREPDQYRLHGQDSLTDPGHHLFALYHDHVCPGLESRRRGDRLDRVWIALGVVLGIMKWGQIFNNRREVPGYPQQA
jgi:hypothetical protein